MASRQKSYENENLIINRLVYSLIIGIFLLILDLSFSSWTRQFESVNVFETNLSKFVPRYKHRVTSFLKESVDDLDVKLYGLTIDCDKLLILRMNKLRSVKEPDRLDFVFGNKKVSMFSFEHFRQEAVKYNEDPLAFDRLGAVEKFEFHYLQTRLNRIQGVSYYNRRRAGIHQWFYIRRSDFKKLSVLRMDDSIESIQFWLHEKLYTVDVTKKMFDKMWRFFDDAICE